jgi:hypothetical protein
MVPALLFANDAANAAFPISGLQNRIDQMVKFGYKWNINATRIQ